ncbi:Major facilitator superfamily domain, general substrate transporter [Akanthomyces lecanii RCEF 1005]|uniref:Major facilitator superfamily domain, general substrate transporter n=1 Tax=Akanthomyces lecanii RCEF 1005 TaxID=1081108 RepID=A0A162MVC2_CORDF|nr:Major facilitator superfamily domain, general substrate transporter [Akanthomyces lecanii RCEF 1005]
MSAGLACYMVSIINASSTFGRIIPAYVGDRVGVLNVMLLFTLLGGIFTLAIWLPAHSNAPLIVYGILYGFSSGCTLSIIPAIVASISDVRDLGTRNGSLYVFAAIATLVGNPIGGAIVSRQNGSFSGLIIFSGVTALLGAVIVVLARHSLVGPALWKKV